MKLLVRNLSRSTTEAALLKMFSEVGTVQSCNLVMDKATNKSKGFAFIEMPKVGEAKIAISRFNSSDLEGSKIRVKKAEQAADEPKGDDD